MAEEHTEEHTEDLTLASSAFEKVQAFLSTLSAGERAAMERIAAASSVHATEDAEVQGFGHRATPNFATMDPVEAFTVMFSVMQNDASQDLQNQLTEQQNSRLRRSARRNNW